ncbi:unnamed protein product [Phyllotreta striolata]|uniref:Arf-GAP domain-containing protein n=1 Tax=Phyllotreta striolata TaxID=444603 RepID=A0A9N9TL93_PHYSR|nr:unnamed protein product [Phyllotreta striolata]
MSLKTEKDKTKQLQDKCQSVLNSLLRDEDNKYCVDCDSKGPRWASWNIGVFLCIRCAGIHRNLGVHISKVKSVNLDSWTPEQVVSLQQMGNSRARAVYEANLPDNFRRPQSDSSLESFIRAKYEHKKYIAREWVPLPMPKVNWEKEIDEEMEKQRRKKKTIVEKKSLGAVEVPQLPKPTNPSPKPSRAVNSSEINKQEKKDNDLLGLQNGEDSFSNFVSAPVTANQVKEKEVSDPAKNEEESFFNQVLPPEKEKVKLDKDSIMALYGNGPSNNFNQFPSQGGQFGSQGQGNFAGFPPPTQPQQNVLNLTNPQNGFNQMGMPNLSSQPSTQSQPQQQQPQQPPQPWMPSGGANFTPQQPQSFPVNPPTLNQYMSNPMSMMTPPTYAPVASPFNASNNMSGFTPNPFFPNQNAGAGLPQQFGNLSINNPAPQTGNMWQ